MSAKVSTSSVPSAPAGEWRARGGLDGPRVRLRPAGLVSLILLIFGIAMDSSLGAHLAPRVRWGESFHWLAAQTLNRAAPAWLLLGWVAYASRRRTAPARQDRVVLTSTSTSASTSTSPIGDSSRALLLIWGIVPLLFMPLVGLIVGADLQLQWGTPFLLFAVAAAMEFASRRVAWSRSALRPALSAFAVIQMLLLVLSQLTSPRGPQALQDHHWRAFDGASLALTVAPAAREILGGPICVVSCPASASGALALELPERPSVSIDGRYDRSPWVDAQLVAKCGALELSDAHRWQVAPRSVRLFPG